MKKQSLPTLMILLVAISIAAYVIYDARSPSSSQEEIEQYLLEQQELKESTPERTEQEALSSGAYEITDEVGAHPGMKAYDFNLPVHGEEESNHLSQHQGNFVVLNLWASWCPPCQEEMPDLVQFHEEHEGEDVEVVGVNMTTQEQNEQVMEQFIHDFEISFPTYMDVDGDVADRYEVLGIPVTFVLDPDGRIVIRRQGFIDYEILHELVDQAREEYEASASSV
ncbi:TlpA family protein disulfide reductase [Texcoconibacillus texcoconensis]|uniref:Thiol-disulfide isomerase/thioredoxin n=1 Tax=Texcoconibacillus texcoconensis TaxID=1095777 RepID=A0A840QNN2_9BACI|nr:TlpA disulfide reductase family protein [Texcoconibacillus texcoconensis]MBB5172996.1 thiol-disulfide isomerase/thioredoxin [Texcoconibacillus texcoconensis]